MSIHEYRCVDHVGRDQWVVRLYDHTEIRSRNGSKPPAHDLINYVVSAPLVGAVFLVVMIAGGITVLKKFTRGRKAVH